MSEPTEAEVIALLEAKFEETKTRIAKELVKQLPDPAKILNKSSK